MESFGDVVRGRVSCFGYDAVTAPPISYENFACGRRDCSGKECMSYQLVWGAFREYLEKNPPDKETRLVQITGQMCRAGLFDVKDKISVDENGADDRVSVTGLRVGGGAVMTAILWTGLAALDILRQLHVYHLAVETKPGEADAFIAPTATRYCGHRAAGSAADGPGVATCARSGGVALTSVLKDAAEAFAALERRATATGDPRERSSSRATS